MSTLRSKEKVKEERAQVRKDLKDKLDIDNIQAVPQLEKIVVNVGLGKSGESVDFIEEVEATLEKITGQEPSLTRARKSVANFEVREGDPQGYKVTLRDKQMVEFLRKLVHIVLPRTKDFRGLDSGSFDGQGNYSFGLTEQGVFPEVSYEEIEHNFGMDITVVTSASNDADARALMGEYEFPLTE